MTKLEILYQDEQLIAINKPNGLLVHRTALACDADEFALQLLRDQIGKPVFPAHRLDRKTSGVLIFALSADANAQMQKQFAENKVKKVYLAIVRGFTDDSGMIDYPLVKENGTSQSATTNYHTLSRTELEIPFGKQQTSRYSIVEIRPETGRMHQIRKHFAHILHPIIGDRPHGCNKQNKLFKENWNMTTMLLHASEVRFLHPISNLEISIKASLNEEFLRTARLLSLNFDQLHSFQKSI
jgi:tRNA pseudouridine65 synthase